MFSNDDVSEEASPLEIRNVNVDLLQRKISDLQKDNKKLHEEATEVRPTASGSRSCGFESRLNDENAKTFPYHSFSRSFVRLCAAGLLKKSSFNDLTTTNERYLLCLLLFNEIIG